MRKTALAVVVVGLAVAPAAWAADLEQNKRVVVDFYEKAINQKDFEAASKHIGPRFRRDLDLVQPFSTRSIMIFRMKQKVDQTVMERKQRVVRQQK